MRRIFFGYRPGCQLANTGPISQHLPIPEFLCEQQRDAAELSWVSPEFGIRRNSIAELTATREVDTILQWH